MRPAWLPDWQKPGQYPDPNEATRLDWAWQFLRRNPEYQQLWAELIQPGYDPAHVDWSLQGAARPALRVSDRVRPSLHEHAGNYLLKPFQERFGIITVPPDPSEPNASVRFSAQFIRYARKPLHRAGKTPGWDYNLSITLGDHDLLVWFDLSRPIEPQLKRAKKLVKEQQEQGVQFRYRPEQYRDYLRLLDADAAGATDAQVAKILYPRLTNKYPDLHGNRQVRGDRAIAQRLQKDPWRIVARDD